MPALDRTSLSNEHFRITQDLGGLVECVRSDRPFADIDEVGRVHAEVADVLASLASARRSLLLDLRRAPSRNDPDFEAAIAPHRKRMLAGWAKVAILVRSAVGGLQVRRHAQADDTPVQVFDDERRARVHVRT